MYPRCSQQEQLNSWVHIFLCHRPKLPTFLVQFRNDSLCRLRNDEKHSIGISRSLKAYVEWCACWVFSFIHFVRFFFSRNLYTQNVSNVNYGVCLSVLVAPYFLYEQYKTGETWNSIEWDRSIAIFQIDYRLGFAWAWLLDLRTREAFCCSAVLQRVFLVFVCNGINGKRLDFVVEL